MVTKPPVRPPKLVLIDAHALIHRAFHAIPFLSTKEGELTNAVFGFTSTVLSVLKELRPTYIAVSFDLPEPTWRHQEYPDYKATRQKAPDELRSQFGRVREVVDALGMPVFAKPGYEADDVIGSLAKQQAKGGGVEVYVVTGDKDSLQLVDEHIKIFTLRKGIKDTVIYDPKLLKKEVGLTAEEFVDYKALKGDPSDNIPGVPGIGDKTAVTLIQRYRNLEGLYKSLKEDPQKHPDIKPKMRENLVANERQAYLSRDLSRIVTDLKLPFKLAACKVHEFDYDRALALFSELGFSSLVPRLKDVLANYGTRIPGSISVDKGNRPTGGRAWEGKSYHLVGTKTALADFLKRLRQQKLFAFDTETAALDSIAKNLVGLSFSWQRDEGWYLPLEHHAGPTLPTREVLPVLRPILEDPKVGKVGHNLKYDYEALRVYGLETKGLCFDTMIGSYLLNPGARTLKLDRLAYQELGYEMQPITELIGEGKAQLSMADVSSEEVANYAAEDADLTWQLYQKLESQLCEVGLDKLMADLELPLVPVLSHMEQRGVKLDTKFLTEIGKQFTKELGMIERQVHKLAGHEFNLNSPSQLSRVLFDELKVGKGKTSRGASHKSTAADQLEKYQGSHKIVHYIIRYRELAKLQGTYVEALPKLVRSDTSRLHTSYSQVVAATGRLSSSDPNLQNIPIRTKQGREIRKAFTTDRGHQLLSADYSQFELRIAAHISQDQTLMEHFHEGLDIHAATAARVAGVSLDEVTPEQRYAAKAVNFSILYGATPHGLAAGTGMSVEAARAYIEQYFKTYPKLRDYMDAMIAKASSDGYVETLFGRRRYLPEIQASSFNVRESAKRMAVNMPIQGTQADILKLAMIHIDDGLAGVSANAHMLLTVHDELVFEVPTREVGEVTGFVTDAMEHAYELSVPIAVEAKVGPNWGTMKELRL